MVHHRMGQQQTVPHRQGWRQGQVVLHKNLRVQQLQRHKSQRAPQQPLVMWLLHKNHSVDQHWLTHSCPREPQRWQLLPPVCLSDPP